MTDEGWYVLRVRQGFEAVVAWRLRKLDLEVFVPERKGTLLEENLNGRDAPGGYVYCRFTPDKRLSVFGIPGVLDIVRASDPITRSENVSKMEWW